MLLQFNVYGIPPCTTTMYPYNHVVRVLNVIQHTRYKIKYLYLEMEPDQNNNEEAITCQR